MPRTDSLDAPKIVVAEDNPDVLGLVRMSLARCGYQVLTAGNGEDALELVRNSHPAAVVLDWIMPGMQGAQVCSALKTDPETASIPVIMLTGKAAQRDVEMGFDHGADEYITKPFEIEELTGILRSFVDPAGPKELPA